MSKTTNTTTGNFLTAHNPNGVPVRDIGLTIRAVDDQGPGGAHHHYVIANFDVRRNASAIEYAIARDTEINEPQRTHIVFQNGPISDAKGANGVTIEALLAICAHRIECFENGPFACSENQQALAAITTALEWLHKRTTDRVARNVEGKNEK